MTFIAGSMNAPSAKYDLSTTQTTRRCQSIFVYRSYPIRSPAKRLRPNTAVKAAPSGRWTLRDKAPRSAPYLKLQGLPRFPQATF